MCKMKLRLRIIEYQLFEALQVPGADTKPIQYYPMKRIYIINY